MSNILIPADDIYGLRVANKRPWFSPARVLIHYIRLLKKIGMSEIEKGRKYQRVREMKAVALFLLGIMKNQEVEFWIQPVLDERIPDVRTFCFGRDKDGNIEQWIQEVEVTTYGEHSHDDLPEFIWKTKYSKRKSYPPYFVVLCELRKTFLLPPLTTLKSELERYKPKGVIALLGRLNPTEEIYRVAQIYPELELVGEFDAGVEARRLHSKFLNQGLHHTIRLFRGAKSTKLSFKEVQGKAPSPFNDFLKD